VKRAALAALDDDVGMRGADLLASVPLGFPSSRTKSHADSDASGPDVHRRGDELDGLDLLIGERKRSANLSQKGRESAISFEVF
jgi:hypothetical protein